MNNSKSDWLPVLVTLQLLTLGLVLIIWFNPPLEEQTESKAAATPGEAQLAYLPRDFVDPYLTPDLLRTIIRQELEALSYLAGNDSDHHTQNKSSEQTVLTPEALQAQEEAAAVSASIIRQAISAGTWTKSDSQALMTYVGNISEQQRITLMQELYGAINRQEMEIQDFPPL